MFWICERGKTRKIQAQKINERVMQRCLIALNPLDHYIKDTLRIKAYGRYVDDFYFFTKDLEEAKTNLKKIRQKVKELGLELNEKKTRIRRFKDGFYFLKTKFFCTETGKIVRKINRKSAVRMRRKLRTFRKWVDESILTKEQAINSYYSWRGHMIRENSYTVLMRMDAYMHIILEC